MDANEPRVQLKTASSRGIVGLLLVIAVWLVCDSAVMAQAGFGRPNDRPTVSPYLNLFRNQTRGGFGNSTLLNYYGLVRPQNQAFEQARQLNQGVYNLQQLAQQPQRIGQSGVPRYSQMGITGHPTAFMTIQPGAGGAAGVGFSGGGFSGGGSVGSGGIAAPGLGGGGNEGSWGGSGFGGSVPAVGLSGFGQDTITGHAATFGNTGVGLRYGN